MSKDKNDVVIINLDRPRELRFGHKAMKTLSAMTGKSMSEMEAEDIDFEQIETYLYCGLLSDAQANHEILKLEQMEDILDAAPSYAHIIEKMQEAFSLAFGSIAEGNLPAPVQAPAPNRAQRRVSGVGKKALKPQSE